MAPYFLPAAKTRLVREPHARKARLDQSADESCFGPAPQPGPLACRLGRWSLGATAAARIDLEGRREQKGLAAARKATARLKIDSLLLQRRLLASELDNRSGVVFLVHKGHAEVEGQPQVPTVTGKADDGVVLAVLLLAALVLGNVRSLLYRSSLAATAT